MKQGPLELEELEWLEDVLMKYGNDNAMLDVSELDGFLTAIVSGPNKLEPGEWLVALWGGENSVPEWESEEELQRFLDLTFQHMNDITERLNDYPDQFEPIFGTSHLDDQEYTIVEEWCFGYMKGVDLDDWSSLPESLQPSLAAIALHGREENFAQIDNMSPEEFLGSIENIPPAALSLHDYWLSKQSPLH
ncbi:uncharacterized protein J2125_003432 [Erwinia toletana]|uniref:YecA family protein n=1 Tax=Winslowiella toletana TaxID=92490 RepID=A0ABS4PC68_9GAMM|nr:UPF0149 family protein [Winslowiella toletana]MBP2170240.1 uncharacterized protein [Winslowiella toletana]